MRRDGERVRPGNHRRRPPGRPPANVLSHPRCRARCAIASFDEWRIAKHDERSGLSMVLHRAPCLTGDSRTNMTGVALRVCGTLLYVDSSRVSDATPGSVSI